MWISCQYLSLSTPDKSHFSTTARDSRKPQTLTNKYFMIIKEGFSTLAKGQMSQTKKFSINYN